MAEDDKEKNIKFDAIYSTISAVSKVAKPSDTAAESAAFIDAQKQLEKEEKRALTSAYVKVMSEVHKDLESNRALREEFGRNAFRYLFVISGVVFVFLFIHLFRTKDWNGLPDSVLLTLSGGTFASAVGLVGFVVKGLFGAHHSQDQKKFIGSARKNGRIAKSGKRKEKREK